jgi:Tetratricopeptide repeat-like domain
VVAAGGAAADPLAFAHAQLLQGRSRGDEGAYTLAEAGLACHIGAHPDDRAAQIMQANVWIQQHRFAEAGLQLKPLAEAGGDWLAWALLGDVSMEQGDFDEAADAYQRAVDLRPGLLLYDRIGWLRWLEGDVEGAREMAVLAVQSATPADPEPMAWVLVRLGWLRALSGQTSPELDAALRLVPDYAPALLARGRVRLYGPDGQPTDLNGGLDDLRRLPHDNEALRFRAAFGDGVTGMPADRRGWADRLAQSDPATALRMVDVELQQRHDPVTRMTRAWVLHHAGQSGEAEAEARLALATGCVEPRLLHHGALILRDAALAERALSMGVALTPPERLELSALLPPTGATP